MWKCWDYNPAALSVCLSAPCSGRESHSQMNRRRRWNIFRLSIQLIKGPKTLFDSHPIISRSDRICICTKNRCRLALWSTDANFGGLNNCWAVWDSKAATIICTYRMLSLNNGPAALRARFASFITLKYRSVGRWYICNVRGFAAMRQCRRNNVCTRCVDRAKRMRFNCCLKFWCCWKNCELTQTYGMTNHSLLYVVCICTYMHYP